MNKDQALTTLINAVKLANKRGAFELEESAVVFNAISILTAKEEPKKEKNPK